MPHSPSSASGRSRRLGSVRAAFLGWRSARSSPYRRSSARAGSWSGGGWRRSGGNGSTAHPRLGGAAVVAIALVTLLQTAEMSAAIALERAEKTHRRAAAVREPGKEGVPGSEEHRDRRAVQQALLRYL